jgi:hypothetical protein
MDTTPAQTAQATDDRARVAVRLPFAAPARRSGLLGDQGLVLCSAARPPGGASRRPTVSTR